MLTADLIQWYCGTCGSHGAWWDVPGATDEVAAKVWRTHQNEATGCEGRPDLHWSASPTAGVAPPAYRGSAARIDVRLPAHWAGERQKQYERQQQQTVEQAAEEEKQAAERQRKWKERQAAEEREWRERCRLAQERLIEEQRERRAREAQRSHEDEKRMERIRAEYAERRKVELVRQAERDRRFEELCARMDRDEPREVAFRRAAAPFERRGLCEPVDDRDCPYFSEPFTIAPFTDLTD